MNFDNYDDGGVFNDRPSANKVAGISTSSNINRSHREIGLLDRIEEILSDLPIPSNQHRNLILRGVNASKYFDDFIHIDFEGQLRNLILRGVNSSKYFDNVLKHILKVMY